VLYVATVAQSTLAALADVSGLLASQLEAARLEVAPPRCISCLA
jgi:hypothetical protein